MEVNTGYRVVANVEPARSSTIGTAVGGRVELFEIAPDQPVEVGLRVERGQVLAKLRTGTLEIERAAAEQQLELYRQELAELRNGSRPEDIAEAEAIADGAKAAMENAARQLERLLDLSNSGAATEVDFEDARERAQTTQFTYAAAQAALQRIRQGPRVEQIAQRVAQVKLQEQRIKLIEDRIEKHKLRSPFDGYVAAKFSEVGAWVSEGDPLVQVVELDQVLIKAPVTANYLPRLKPGDSVRVEFPDLPDRLMIGSVERISPVADARARTFPVFIRLENELRSEDVPLLRAGMLARVELAAGTSRVLPLIPKDALVVELKDNKYHRSVFVVEGDQEASGTGKVKQVEVGLGVASGEMIQVSGQLKASQFVVVVGNERLNDGDAVSIFLKDSKLLPEG
jgi:HlyD family secretion protein